MENSTLNIIVPLYNEEDSLEAFHRRLTAALQPIRYPWSIYYVNDGSTDHTSEILNRLSTDERINVVQFTRNFGHQAALTAGIDLAEGDIVITLDGDGQHPPELIPEMIKKYEEGFSIVQMKRLEDTKTSWFKRKSSLFFYRLINQLGELQISPGTSDFRLVTRQVVLSLREVRETHRIIRGIIPWLGFSTAYIPYLPEQRMAGKSKYTLKKMFSLAENAIFSFSLVPLRIGLVAGFIFLFLALVEAVYVLSFWVTGRQQLLAPGWSSIVFLILSTGGLLMVLISILGIYVGQIFQQVKGRPLYIIQKIIKHE